MFAEKMFNLENYKPRTKIYLALISFLAVAGAIVFCRELISYDFTHLLSLVVAAVISYFISRHQFYLPNSRLKFSGSQVMVIWGILWLGTAGAVVLACAAIAATYSHYRKDKVIWLAASSSRLLSTIISSTFFYFLLNKLSDEPINHLNISEAGLLTLTASIIAAAIVKYFSYNIAFSTFLISKSESPDADVFKKELINTLPRYLAGLAGGLAFHFIFSTFGLQIGLFILPIVVAADFANRIYLQKLEQKTKLLSESNRIHMATVEALATAIDARDQIGDGHVRRTQIIAVEIGNLLGLSYDEIKALRTGALLHDIGKLAVPDHILNKPGRLAPAEMEKMKIHAGVSASILEKVNFPYPVVETVKYHHEAWDGSGYPEGLKKENIPLTARILTVADAYDSLRGVRPYRKAVGRDEARRHLLNGSGGQFDPKIVDVFLRNLKQIELEIENENLSYDLESKIETFHAGAESADERQSYVEQIKRANREVFTLYELAKVFSSSLTLQDTLSLFVKKVGELMPFDTCAVYLVDGSKEYARISYVKGLNEDLLDRKKIKVGEGATGYVLKKRQGVLNVNPDLDFTSRPVTFVDEYTTMASLPLIAEDNLIGAISIYSCDLEGYEEEHMRLLETVSRIAADAILKALRYAETEIHAMTDPMTELPNARSLKNHFENEAARSRRNEVTFQLIMLDLDGFKAVNDTFGHKTGDILLKEVSKIMRNQLREYDFLARYAGDEFVAIIPETSKKDVEDLCERIENAVNKFSFPVGNEGFAKVGVSIGSACFPFDGETLDQVIVAADRAMYSVKAARKRKQMQEKETAGILQTAVALDDSNSSDFRMDEIEVVELDESHIISSALN